MMEVVMSCVCVQVDEEGNHIAATVRLNTVKCAAVFSMCEGQLYSNKLVRMLLSLSHALNLVPACDVNSQSLTDVQAALG